uniref:prepilin-type N-terminal cleavage/methylation domain-containing protein n=1 Tax=Halomonas sp. TaxID=1486246 RepID=UPI002639C5CC|nr:prepilin-type N-terminal cleavage/methylation domain-containing protein [Halomonas sp.]
MSAGESEFRSPEPCASNRSGFTLLEALVALLVLSSGLLGVAAMQARSLQGAHASVQWGIADLAAQDARERLWAALASGDPRSCPLPSVVNASDWRQHWRPFLPGLSANPVTALPDCAFVIEIDWQDARFGSETMSLEYRLKLPSGRPKQSGGDA